MTTATAAMTSAAKNIHDPQGPRTGSWTRVHQRPAPSGVLRVRDIRSGHSAAPSSGELALPCRLRPRRQGARRRPRRHAGRPQDPGAEREAAEGGLLEKRERAAAAKRLGIDLRAAERAQRTLADVQAWAGQMHLHFSTGKQSGALGDSKALLEAINLNMMLVLNQPKSGLWNLMSLADFPLLFRGLGKTSRSAVARFPEYLLKGMVGSSLETFGIHMPARHGERADPRRDGRWAKHGATAVERGFVRHGQACGVRRGRRRQHGGEVLAEGAGRDEEDGEARWPR